MEKVAVYIAVRVMVEQDPETWERTPASDQHLTEVVNDLVAKYGADNVRRLEDGDGTLAEEFPS